MVKVLYKVNLLMVMCCTKAELLNKCLLELKMPELPVLISILINLDVLWEFKLLLMIQNP